MNADHICLIRANPRLSAANMTCDLIMWPSGKAPVCKAGSRRFKSCRRLLMVTVADLVKALRCERRHMGSIPISHPGRYLRSRKLEIRSTKLLGRLDVCRTREVGLFPHVLERRRVRREDRYL